MKSNKKDLKLEFNKLVEYLGGKDNIVETEVDMSRFKVTLKDIGSEDLIKNFANEQGAGIYTFRG